VFISAINS